MKINVQTFIRHRITLRTPKAQAILKAWAANPDGRLADIAAAAGAKRSYCCQVVLRAKECLAWEAAQNPPD